MTNLPIQQTDKALTGLPLYPAAIHLIILVFVTAPGFASMTRFPSLLFGFFLASPAWSDEPVDDQAVESTRVIMHKNPGCGCCDLWADHMRSHGFTVESSEDREILGFKADRNIPRPLMSCHTAVIDGYFVEGHVPANDILRLLKERPGHVSGVAVPGMPLGSPGMEHPRPQDFNTIALLTDGTAYVFATHEAGEDFSAK